MSKRRCEGNPVATPCGGTVMYEIQILPLGTFTYRCANCWTKHVGQRNEAWKEAHREREVSRALRARLRASEERKAAHRHAAVAAAFVLDALLEAEDSPIIADALRKSRDLLREALSPTAPADKEKP